MKQIQYHKGKHPGTGKEGYLLDGNFTEHSKRYNRSKTVYDGMWSDGATGFVDLGSDGYLSRLFAWCRNRLHKMTGNKKSGWFFIHDQLCIDGLFDFESHLPCISQAKNGRDWSINGPHRWEIDGEIVRCTSCGEELNLHDFKVDNLTASTVAADMLWGAGWMFWSVPVWWATWLFGGGEARKNGMFRVKEKR